MTADDPRRGPGDQPSPPPSGPGDTTSPMPPVPGDGATAPLVPPPGDATRPMPAFPAGEPAPGEPAAPDATAVMPGVGGSPAGWSARAEVPRFVPEPTPPAWREEEPEGRRWWLPVLLTLVALVLLGALGYGAWLLVGGDSAVDPVPSASPSAVRPTAARTTTAPATRTPPPTVAPQRVAVPDLAGDRVADAQQRLRDAGLSNRVRYRTTDSYPPGVVIETDPGAGRAVAPGTVVTLFVAEPPAPEPTDPLPTPTAEVEQSP